MTIRCAPGYLCSLETTGKEPTYAISGLPSQFVAVGQLGGTLPRSALGSDTAIYTAGPSGA